MKYLSVLFATTIIVQCVVTLWSTGSLLGLGSSSDGGHGLMTTTTMGSTRTPQGNHQRSLSGTTETVLFANFDTIDDVAGFVYQDDVFHDTNQRQYASGSWRSAGKVLRTALGGKDNVVVNDGMSGGFITQYTLTSTVAGVFVNFRYKVLFSTSFDAGDNFDVLCSINGILYGLNGNEYVERFVGTNDDSDIYPDTYKYASISVGSQMEGTYQIILGGHLSQKDEITEEVVLIFDDVEVTTTTATMSPLDKIILDTDFNTNQANFVFHKDIFVDGDEAYTSGGYTSNKGTANTGGLFVRLGGVDDVLGLDMSAGWKYAFTTMEDQLEVTIQFDYRVFWAFRYDDGDYSRIMMAIDNDTYDVDYYDNSSPHGTSEWKTATVNVGIVNAGAHTLDLGGINNQKDHANKRTLIYFDNIRVVGTIVTTSNLIESNFDVDLDGFQYIDHPWGYRIREDFSANYADGSYTGTGGENGDGGLHVALGGLDGKDVWFGMGGGYQRSIDMIRSGRVTISFSYYVVFGRRYDVGEYSEVLCSVDGVLFGTNNNEYVDYTTKGVGNIPWTNVTLDIGLLSAGVHNIIIGGYNNQKHDKNEKTDIYIDNVVVTVTDSNQTPAPTPSISVPTSTPTWEIVPTIGDIQNRHEACFVMVHNKAYLIGGRRDKRVDIYDTITSTWSPGNGPGIEVNHMQCVAVDDSVYIVSAWTGKFPTETNLDVVMVYNTNTDTWSNKTALPESRRRGGSAAVLVGREIYLTHGNRGGHGDHATALGWTDKYNVDTDTWTTELADAPNPRDHAGGALMYDGRICVAGGRDGGRSDFFNAAIIPTDCYNPMLNIWTVESNIPMGRAGSSYGTTCNGELIIAGGEGYGIAFDDVHIFDGISWRSAGTLVQARHGTGVAISCNNITTMGGCRQQQQIYIASGSGAQGGSPELGTVERFVEDDGGCTAS